MKPGDLLGLAVFLAGMIFGAMLGVHFGEAATVLPTAAAEPPTTTFPALPACTYAFEAFGVHSRMSVVCPDALPDASESPPCQNVSVVAWRDGGSEGSVRVLESSVNLHGSVEWTP